MIKETILIVDDDDFICKIISEYLSDKSYKVFIAEDGKTALDIFNKKKIEIQWSQIISVKYKRFDSCWILKTLERKIPLSSDGFLKKDWQLLLEYISQRIPITNYKTSKNQPTGYCM